MLECCSDSRYCRIRGAHQPLPHMLFYEFVAEAFKKRRCICRDARLCHRLRPDRDLRGAAVYLAMSLRDLIFLAGATVGVALPSRHGKPCSGHHADRTADAARRTTVENCSKRQVASSIRPALSSQRACVWSTLLVEPRGAKTCTHSWSSIGGAMHSPCNTECSFFSASAPPRMTPLAVQVARPAIQQLAAAASSSL
eukprot:SAG11_NODE_758_length_7313_cov_10.164818_1_plen_197_part_00